MDPGADVLTARLRLVHRGELRYQAPDHVPTESKVLRARIVAVRFVRTRAAPTSQAADGSTVLLDDVPRRAFSEAIRDVSLAIEEAATAR